MSKQVDERVVEMRFDNRDFENNVKTTMSTLEKLKASLNLKGASKGLEEINAAAKNTNVSGIGTAVDTVQAKFSALQVVGVTALANITNSAVNAGKRIVSALTIDPIKTGFQEYELKMGSVQTIMASSGESLETVNRYLAELNTYADKTIYSFSDMTSNIGKFTNAGVKLEDAVAAIKGISNEAAVSGANANEASRAMYNFAQALSAGYVKLIDWKSIENANMATVEFKNELLKTALAIGTVVKQNGKYVTTTTNAQGKVSEAFTATSMFNESLAHQWMTTEVLTETLGRYADETTKIGKKAYASAQDVKTFSQMFDTLKEAAQSGWSETWELIVGDFNEAKSFLTTLSNFFGDLIEDSAEARNSMLEIGLSDNWSVLSNKVQATGISIKDFKEELKKTAKTHGVSVDKMIKETGSFRKSLKKGWLTTEIFTETLKKFSGGADKASKSTKKISESTVDVKKRLEELKKVAKEVIRGDFGNGEARVKALTKAGYDYAEVQNIVNKTLKGQKVTIKDVTSVTKKMSDAQLKSAGYTEEQIKQMRELEKQAGETGSSIDALIKGTSNQMTGRQMVVATIKNILEQISKILGTIKKAWTDAFGETSASDKLYDGIKAIYDFVGTAEVSTETLNNLGSAFKGFFDALWLLSTLSGGVFGTLRKMLQSIATVLGFGNVWGLLGHIGGLISEFRSWITTNNQLSQSLTEIGNKIVEFVDTTILNIAKWITEFLQLETVKENIKALEKAFASTLGGLLDWILGFGSIFSTFIEQIRSLDSLTFEGVLSALENLWSAIVDRFSNLSGVFSGLVDTVIKIVDDILHYFGLAGTGSISEFIRNFTWEDFIQALTVFGENVRNFFSNFGNNFDGISNDIISGLVNGLQNGASKVYETITNIGAKILEAIKAVLGIHSPSTEFFEVGKNAIQGLINGITSMLSGLFSFLGDVGKMVLDIFKDIDWGTVLTIAFSAGFFVVSYKLAKSVEKISDAFEAIAHPFKSIGKVLESFGKVLDSVSSQIKAQALKTKAEALKSLAIAIAILVGSIYVLSKLDPLAVAGSIAAIAVLAGILVGLSVALTKFSDASIIDSAKISAMLLALGSSLLMFALTLKIVSTIDDDGVDRAIAAIVAFGGLIAVLVAMTQYAGSERKIEQAAAMIAKLGAAFLIVAVAAKIIATMSWDDLGRAGTGIAGLLAFIVGLMAATKLVGPSYNVAKIGATILAVAGAMALLAMTGKIIAGMEPEEMGKAAAGIVVLSGIITGLIAATKLAGGNDLKGVAVTLLAMSASIAILAGVCVLLGLVNEETMKKGLKAMSWLAAIVSVMVAVTHFAKDVKSTFIGLAIAIGAMGAALAILTFVDPTRLMGATAALSIVIGMFATVVAATNLMTSSIGPLVVMSVAITLLAAGLYLLGGLPIEQSLSAAIALSTLLMAFAIACNLLNGINGISKSALISMVVLTAIIAALGGVLVLISSMNVQAAKPSAVALSILLLAMSGACAVLGTIVYISKSSLVAIGILTAVVAGLAIILGILSAFDITPSLETATALSTLLLAMSAAVGILGLIAPVAQAAVVGATALVELVAIITAAIIALGAISQIPGVQWLVEEGGNFLQKIGTAIGQFVGGIVAGVAEGATSTLPQVANNLSTFMTNLTPFLDGIKSIDESSLTSVKALTDMILTLTAAGLIDKISSWLTGGSSIVRFALQLIPFGEAIKKYSQIVTGIDTAAIESSATAGKALAQLANTLPKEGGLAQAIFGGTTDLTSFGIQLVTFGAALKAYSISVAGLDTESITKSVDAGRALSDLANALPDDSGWIDAIFGGQDDLSGFGKKLASFGEALKSYGESVAEVDFAKISTSTVKVKAIVDLINDAVNMDTSGVDNLKKIKDVGSAIKKYGEKVSELNTSKISQSITSMQKFVSTISSLSSLNTDGIPKFTKALTNLGKVSLDGFVSAFQNGGDKVSGAINKMVNSAASSVSKSKTRFSSAGTAMVNALASSITTKGAVVNKRFVSLMNSCIKTVSSNESKFRTNGAKLISEFAKGIESKTSSVKSSISKMLSDAKTVIHGYYDDFESAGKYLGTGLVVGIKSKETAAYNAGYRLGKKAVQGEKDGQESKSPSKATIKAGKWLGEGLVIGINSMGKKVYSTSHDLGSSAVQSISSAISKIPDMLDGNIDSQPTIRPVIDLTDVKSGASAISSMFSGPQLVTATANVNAIGSMMSRRNQNGAQTEIVSAIDKLRKDVGNLEKPTYNIGNIAYEDGDAVSDAIEVLTQALRIGRRN